MKVTIKYTEYRKGVTPAVAVKEITPEASLSEHNMSSFLIVPLTSVIINKIIK